MNERIEKLVIEAFFDESTNGADQKMYILGEEKIQKFAELIVRECADICMEMAAKCSGLPGEGALGKDCADWIKKDFGVEDD